MALLLVECSKDFDGKNGVKIVHFPNTNKVSQSVEYKNGLKNGFFKEYYKNGNLRMKEYYINDKVKDTSYFYYEDGKLASFQIIIKGKKEGCWKKYNKGGKVYSQVCFKDDDLDGTTTIYSYQSVKLIKRYNYKNGWKHGEQETFYNNGKPQSKMFYFNNRPNIGTKEWYESGKLVDNTFRISVIEKNETLLENMLKFHIKLENPKETDKVYRVSENDKESHVTPLYELRKLDNYFVLYLPVTKGGFVMEKIKIAAFRKTQFGNTAIETSTFNAAANNYY